MMFVRQKEYTHGYLLSLIEVFHVEDNQKSILFL